MAALVALFGVWLVFVSTLELPEVVLGAVSAVFVAIGGAVLRQQIGRHDWPHPGWLWQAKGLGPRFLKETWLVFAALFRQLTGKGPVRSAVRAAPYPGVYRNEAEAGAADGFAITANSLTPNVIVLDVDRLEGVIVMHQLVPAGPERLQRELVLPA